MKNIFIALVVALTAILPVSARTSPDPVLEDIVNSYMPWHSAEFNGRLKYDKLPLSPTIKMYMVRDSLLQISVRAPLMGEVGRLNLTKDEITVVNKLKRVYCKEPTQKLLDIYPGVIGDLQSLFLARVVLLGEGEMNRDNAVRFEVEEDREGGWMLIPETGEQVVKFNYGYIVSGNGRTSAFVAAMPGEATLELKYGYRNRGEQIDIEFERKEKKIKAQLDFTSVKWGGSELPALRLGNYQQVSVKDFMRSFKK